MIWEQPDHCAGQEALTPREPVTWSEQAPTSQETDTAKGNDREVQVVQAFRDMYRGMTERDIALLDHLLDDGFTLSHMTGTVQSKWEWLGQVRSGAMRYYTSQEQDIEVTLAGDTAILIGRNVVDARIWGTRGKWNLQLETAYHLISGQWVAIKMVAKSYPANGTA